MNKQNAFIFPGQGAQRPKMGQDFYDAFLEAKEVFQQADDLLSFSLSKLIFQGSMEEITETKYCQAAIFVTSMALVKTFQKQFPSILPCMTGGLSLGEYSALLLSQKLDFASVLDLVWKRGHFMDDSAKQILGVMLAVLGLEPDHILPIKCWIANLNAPGQVIVACRKEDMEEVISNLRERGASRIIPLPVAGAFHSPLMKDAMEKLKPFIEASSIVTSDIALVMNVPGKFVYNATEIKHYLIQQVASPTLWMECVRSMEERGAERYIEFGPTQLKAINRRIGVRGESITIENVKDLDYVYEAIKG